MECSLLNLSVLSVLTMSQIIATLPPKTFSRTEKRSRVNLELAISRLPQTFIETLIDLAARSAIVFDIGFDEGFASAED
jgi:hypothetical protein